MDDYFECNFIFLLVFFVCIFGDYRDGKNFFFCYLRVYYLLGKRFCGKNFYNYSVKLSNCVKFRGRI